ncbi:DUF4838 domain-containing protein [Paenibacillus eucommiae]|uniref:SLH domain-containing protein n=1 Tax=Paenibacillus eucommiae TaxID=1355755 RepID=A0ABS4IY45_9BACL|nr:DUF4838 domain-containing protein [Paenibacillus eucommiae]MBP1992509.1 hypothetical protein [Paenibacillus eucommiae]
MNRKHQLICKKFLIWTIMFSLMISTFSSVNAAAAKTSTSVEGSPSLFQGLSSDIAGHWAEQTLAEWISTERIQGYPDGSFRPDQDINRGEAFALINRSFGFDEQVDAQFSDLSATDWVYTDVLKAVKAGYTEGYPDGTIGTQRQISRQEAAIVITRLLGLEAKDDGNRTVPFTDAAQIPSWSKGAVNVVAEANIMLGYEDGSFQPEANITRAELIITLDRALNFNTMLDYTEAGTYGPGSGMQVLNGDVTIHASGVILQNIKINGNLLLAEGIQEGDVTLRNVRVSGMTTVQGGGKNSIHIEDSALTTLTVDRKTGIVRIVTQGKTTIAELFIKTPVILEQLSTEKENGIPLIQIEEALSSGSNITLNGQFKQIEVKAKGIAIDLLKGVIQQLSLAKQAQENVVTIADGAKIIRLILDAIAKITGPGVVEHAAISESAKGTTFEKQPQQTSGAGTVPSAGGGWSTNTGGGNETPSTSPTPTPTSTPTTSPTSTPAPTNTPAPVHAAIVSVHAENGEATVTFDAAPDTQPASGDFNVQQIINGGSPVSVAIRSVHWDADAKEAVLTLPAISSSNVLQSVIYTISYKEASAVQSNELVIAAGIPIVGNMQGNAVVVIKAIEGVDGVTGWKPLGTIDKTKVNVSGTQKNSSENSLHINDDDGAINFSMMSNKVAVTPGKSYTANAHYYLESGDLNPVLYIYFFDESESLLDTYPYSLGDQRNSWKSLTAAGVAPAGAKYASVVLQSDSSGKRSVYFDDISLKETNGAALPIDNPGFEEISTFASKTLVSYIQKSSGVELPIVTEEKLQQAGNAYSGMIPIYVGGTIPAEESALKQKLQDLNAHGFIIQTKNDEIRIAGLTDRAVEFGVFEFLERYLGVRWLMPGEEGEHVPQSSAIAVPLELIVEEPTSISRHVFFMDRLADNVEWMRHNRMHDNIQFHHNLEHLFDPTVFKDHPEYYSGGKVPEAGSWDWNPCLNDETAAAAVKRIVEYFEKYPDATSYSLGVTDSRTHCESDPNHPNYPGEDHVNSVGLLNISDLYYPWVNSIVEGVLHYYDGQENEGKLNDKYFGLLAYAQVYDPPRNEDGSIYKLHPNVVPYITDDRLTWLDPEINAEAQALMADWTQAAENIGFYEYLYGSPYNSPRMYLKKMAENYQYATQHNVIGHVAEWLPGFEEGPKLWLAAKLQWNSEQDAEALTREWYETAVGAAAAPYLEQYYDHWELFWTTRMFETDWYLKWKNSVPRYNYLNIYTHEYLTSITLEDLQKTRALMEQVLDLAENSGTENQYKRAKFLMEGFEFYEASALSFPRIEPVAAPADEAAALTMLAEFRQSLQMAELRKQYIAEKQMRYMQQWNGVQEVLLHALQSYVDLHEDENGPIRQAIDQVLTEYPGLVRRPAYAVKTDAGKEIILQSLNFNQGPWVHAKPIGDFLTTPDKLQPPVETKVRILWDDENVYVGYENFDPHPNLMVTNDDVNMTNNWWNGATPDSVETFLGGDINASYKAFFSNFNDVKLSWKASATSQQGDPGMPWEVRSQVYSDRWNTVQAIPFSSLGVNPNEVSSLMGFFLRNYHSPVVHFSWYGGNTWSRGDFNIIHLVEQPAEEELYASAVNGTISVKLPAEAPEPSLSDFSIKQVVNGGAPVTVTPTAKSWNENSRIVQLSVPTVEENSADQSVVYQISYKDDLSVETVAFVVKGGLVIVKDEQPQALLVVPQQKDAKIAGWWTPNTNGAGLGNVGVVSDKKLSGQYSLHILDDADDKNFGAASNRVAITGGASYTFNTSVYLEWGDAPAVMVYLYDEQFNQLNEYPFIAGGQEGAWTVLSKTFTAPANAAYMSVVMFADVSGKRSFYADDVVILDANEEPLALENAGFEQISTNASDLFAEYVWKSSQANLPTFSNERLNNEPAAFPDDVRIYIGVIPAGDEALADAVSDLQGDQYFIKVDEDKIVIMSLTEAGTVSGVKAFLQTYMGVKWAVPGESAEFVPSLNPLIIRKQ